MLGNATQQNTSLWEFRGEYDYVDTWFLMSTPLPIMTIWVAYIAFVLKIGPKFMEKRPPFSLNNVLVLYNAVQIIISCFVFSVGCNLILQNGLLLQKRCLSESEDLQFYTAAGTYYYLIAKVTELLDTVFFVLRKKDNQITFLHVYHHSVTMLSSWFALKYEPSYSTVFLGTTNSFVHIIMYTYYGLSAFPELSKYLWWKKYITTMQLVQFLLMASQALINYKMSPCRPSYGLLSVILFNAFLFMYLFGDFYVKSYIKNKRNMEIKNQRSQKEYSNGKSHIGDTNGNCQKDVNVLNDSYHIHRKVD